MDSDEIKQQRIMRSAFVWNTAGSLLNAFQSVFILIALTRILSLEEAGIFTLAFAEANLFLNLGKYGMRNFQASDVEPRYSFRAYGLSRLITCISMVLFGSVHLAYSAISNSYSSYKTVAILLMILLKVIDAVEDVYDGSFQQEGRLDIAGKQMTFRLVIMVAIFIITAALSKSIVTATMAAIVASVIVLLFSLKLIKDRYGMPEKHAEAPASSSLVLLKECAPLFIAAFLLFYVGNAPKYAIDTYLDDVAQAQYGFIAMPVFIVGLLAQFVYMPMIEPLSRMWADGNRTGFMRAFAKQIMIVVVITAVCVAGAGLLGVPVLSALYNTNLVDYRIDLCILVFGGGFLALASLFTTGITIMRKQDRLVIGYVVVAICAWASSNLLVRLLAVRGASLAYIGCMGALALIFGLIFVLSEREIARESKPE